MSKQIDAAQSVFESYFLLKEKFEMAKGCVSL
jgi:hypothetical protein